MQFYLRIWSIGVDRSNGRIWMIAMMMTFIIFTLNYLSITVVRRRLSLWNHICKVLGIKDRILHKVIGTSLIPYVRKQPFDYYLPRPRKLASDDKSELGVS